MSPTLRQPIFSRDGAFARESGCVGIALNSRLAVYANTRRLHGACHLHPVEGTCECPQYGDAGTAFVRVVGLPALRFRRLGRSVRACINAVVLRVVEKVP